MIDLNQLERFRFIRDNFYADYTKTRSSRVLVRRSEHHDAPEITYILEELMFPTKLEWYQYFKTNLSHVGYTLKEVKLAYKQFLLNCDKLLYHKLAFENCWCFLSENTTTKVADLVCDHKNKYPWEVHMEVDSEDKLQFLNEIPKVYTEIYRFIYDYHKDYQNFANHFTPLDLKTFMSFGIEFIPSWDHHKNRVSLTAKVVPYGGQKYYHTIVGHRFRSKIESKPLKIEHYMSKADLQTELKGIYDEMYQSLRYMI